MKKFHILTFGCQMNYADSARIKAILKHCGFCDTLDISQADIVIFDTCSVRQKSEDKITGKLKEIRPDQKVRITGCMIQHNLRNSKLSKMCELSKTCQFEKGNFLGSIKVKLPNVVGLTNKEIEDLDPRTSSLGTVFVNHAFNPMFHKLQKKWKNIELLRRIDDTGFLPLILSKLGYKIKYDKELINEYENIIPAGQNTSMNITHNKTAYVPISTGCNQFCAYCIVPYARGLEKNFPVKKIIDEVKMHLSNDAEEIVLLGQIVNKHPEFVKIVKEVLKLRGLKWLRYTSPYPTYYSRELLKLHETNIKLCPHIHMPLQSGSDKILKKMFRGYSVADARKFIDNIRKLKREISITTDIIVGFPGETEEDFEDTLKLIKYGRFDMIYIGIYSSRPGTLAQRKYSDDISREVKRDRRNRVNDVLTQISLENNKKEIGKIKTMLVNEIKKDSSKSQVASSKKLSTCNLQLLTLCGYTEDMKQIIVPSIKYQVPSKKNKKNRNLELGTRNGVTKVGEFVKVKIIDGIPFKLIAKL